MAVVIEEAMSVFASIAVVIAEIALIRSSWSYNYTAHESVDTKRVSELNMLSTFILIFLYVCFCFSDYKFFRLLPFKCFLVVISRSIFAQLSLLRALIMHQSAKL